ncbi:fimbria/pilus outer membrane usher protein [Pseudomonas brassicacearum]|uniref:fimbria/pilus outer membrane usher protein n=1 Tax=Pseudomonas brassicacearum TaxID=930166 RepID=UPI001D66B43F|nr:fimbria/pilus outer membrane usher protein [Pseudomonas brassicacearum]CAH0279858.1 Outer membrane usher protein FimD [Pseudomonas brassicacearum]
MRFRVFFRLAAGLALLGITQAETTAETFAEFDRSVLEARGLDPQIAEYFRDAPRFPAGRHLISLSVNGASSGEVMATFDEQGQLCLDANLLDRAAIAAPPGLYLDAETVSCSRVTESLPGARVWLEPGLNLVRLLVPTDWLLAAAPRQDSWTSGGMAGVINYDALMVNGSAAGQSSQYRSLGTELGFNAGDWVVRSRQNYSSFAGVTRFETLYTQASKTWERYGAQVQLGQLNMRSSLFAGEPFFGAQILPETALSQASGGVGGGALVQGLAYSTARVEVRQSGVVIFNTLVPAGPFTLSDLPLLSQRLDLEVSVLEENGERRDFRVPAANLRPVSLRSAPSYALAVGKVRRLNNDERDTPSFFALSRDWRFGQATQLSGGVMGADEYRSMGWGIEQALTRNMTARFQQLGSRTARGTQGHDLQAALNTVLNDGFSIGLTTGRRSRGFRHLAETGVDVGTDDRLAWAERHWAISLRHADPRWGALSGSLTRYSGAMGRNAARISTAWSRTFDRTTLSLNVQHDHVGQARNTGISANLSVPLGRSRRISTFVRRDDDRGLRTGARYTEQVSDSLGYSVGVDRPASGQNALNARLSALPRYTSVDIGLSRSGAGAQHYDLALRGGLALHEDGVTPSPYPLRDTFGLIKVGDDAGVRIGTPHGPVWTDAGGRAVASSLSAYQASRIEIDTSSLPRNLDVPNGFQEVRAARGAVPRLDFQTGSVRRLMLSIRTDEGVPVSKGLGVYDEHDQYLTTVVDTGLVYLDNAPAVVRLRVLLSEGRACSLELDTGRLPAASGPYDSAEVVCQTG